MVLLYGMKMHITSHEPHTACSTSIAPTPYACTFTQKSHRKHHGLCLFTSPQRGGLSCLGITTCGEVQKMGVVAGQAAGKGSKTGSSAVQERVAIPRRSCEVLGDEVAHGQQQSSEETSAAIGKQNGELIDGLVFREKFVIRCYEVGTNRTASMETMANLLQEVACNHAQSVGFSTDGFATTPIMRERHLIWVTTRMHIEMKKYPVWGDSVEIDTWYQGEGRIETRRDWIIKHDSSGEEIGRATSTWVMMNMDTRRLSRIPDDVRQEYMPFVPNPARWAFDPKENISSTTKINGMSDFAPFVRPNLTPRRNDLDMNQHVNNVTYISWMLEAIPFEVSSTFDLTQISLDYKCECKADDFVESVGAPENTETSDVTTSLLEFNHTIASRNGAFITSVPIIPVNGSPKDVYVNGYHPMCTPESSHSPLLFLHVLRLRAGGKVITRGRTEWRRKSLQPGSLQGQDCQVPELNRSKEVL